MCMCSHVYVVMCVGVFPPSSNRKGTDSDSVAGSSSTLNLNNLLSAKYGEDWRDFLVVVFGHLESIHSSRP